MAGKLIVLCLLLFLAGCAQVIVESEDITIKVNTLFKDINFSEINVPAFFNLKMYRGESKDMTAITPGGAVSMKGSGI